MKPRARVAMPFGMKQDSQGIEINFNASTLSVILDLHSLTNK